MATDWKTYLGAIEDDKPTDQKLPTIHYPWYDLKHWDVNDWSSAASILVTGAFWYMTRRKESKS